MDERAFVENLRFDNYNVLKKEILPALNDFAQKTLDNNFSQLTLEDMNQCQEYKKSKDLQKHLSKVPYSLKIFMTTFKKNAGKMPLDVIFAESNYEQADKIVTAVDNLCEFLDKEGQDTKTIANKSTFGKLELGTLLIESKSDLMDAFEKTMLHYQKKCEDIYDNMRKARTMRKKTVYILEGM